MIYTQTRIHHCINILQLVFSLQTIFKENLSNNYAELIQSQGPTLDPNTMIECTTNHSCEGSPVTSTMKDCCDHDIEPSGFAYTIPGVEVCHLCPVGKIVLV